MSVSGGRKFRDRKDLQRQLTTNGLSKKEFEILDELPYLTLDDIRYCFNEGPIARAIHEGDPNGPPLALLKTIRNPDYFWFTCRHIFNIELLPFQAVILKELWNRPFPMLVASRGFGKSFILGLYALLRALLVQGSKVVLCGASFRQAKIIFEYCESIWYAAPLFKDILGSSCTPHHENDKQSFRIGRSMISALPLGDGCLSNNSLIISNNGFIYINKFINSNKNPEIIKTNIQIWGNGKFNFSDESYCKGLEKTKKIRTHNGYEIEATLNHKFKVVQDQQIVWKTVDEIKIGDYIPIDRTKRWHNGNFQCSKEQAYSLGLMIGDGSWVNKYHLRYTTADLELLTAIEIGTGFKFKDQSGYHYNHYSKKNIANWLDFWKLTKCYTIDKCLPETILSAPKECMTACIQGLFDTDGFCSVKGQDCTIGFTNTSKKLIDQLHYILLHYGIISYVTPGRKRKETWNISYDLLITGYDVIKFHKEINFKLTRKKEKLDKYIVNKKQKYYSKTDEIPNVREIILNLIENYPPKRGEQKKYSRRTTKSDVLRKITINSNTVKKIIERYKYTNDPIIKTLENLCDDNIYYDTVRSIEDSESVVYDIHIPEVHEYCANGFYSHNSKIRGARATDLLVDEFHSIAVAVFENVLSGFAAVTSSPIQNVKQILREKLYKDFGLTTNVDYVPPPNKSIIAGTPYYQFNHFYAYFIRWKAIVESKGDERKLREIFKNSIPEGFDWRDYSVIRIPYDLIPEGFMDIKTIGKSKASGSTHNYLLEYCALFSKDSDGFYRRSLIESCVVNDTNKITTPAYGEIRFSAALRGQPGSVYVMGIDPASEQDNFSIIILEICKDHKRIVHCWTTNRKKFRDRFNENKVEDNDFYYYCARKIRELMEMFPCARIGLDLEGGGRAIREALGNTKALKEGELPIYEIIVEDKPKDTDNKHGLHILECVSFSSAEWVSTANHTLRMDFESKTLLFPFFDSASLEMAAIEDYSNKREYDTLEDCVLEIEELKDELSSIVISRTPNGNRDRWDTPEVKLPGGKKGKQRKDRYTSLLIANACCRSVQNQPAAITYERFGGFSKTLHQQISEGGAYYTGDEWINEHFRKNGGYY